MPDILRIRVHCSQLIRYKDISYFEPNSIPDVIPALSRIAGTAPALTEAAAFVLVFFFVEELLQDFLVELVLLTAVPEEELL